MPGALDPVTVKNPTKYGALTMGGEQFTGLWTQRSPYRDAATAYLIKKFYQGSRFDSIWDGINREISVRLTDVRRPGSSVFNSAMLPPALNFQSFKWNQNGTEVVRVLEDTAPAVPTTGLTVADTECVAYTRGHITTYFLVMTYMAAVPAWVPGQTYTNTGLTTHAELNGLPLGTQSPAWAHLYGITLTADQAFFVSPEPVAWSTVADTGTATVSGGTAGPALLDITTSGSSATVFTKSSKAGQVRSMALGATLYMADGADELKWLESQLTWAATTQFAPGTVINQGATPGNCQMALGGISMNVTGVGADGSAYVTVQVSQATIPENFANLVGVSAKFGGLTTATYLNGNTYAIANIVSTTLGIFEIALVKTLSPLTADTGSASTGSGYSGGTAPAWSSTQYGVTADGGQQWKYYGTAVKNWGLQPPPAALMITAEQGGKFWQAGINIGSSGTTAILDSNLNVELWTTSAAAPSTGLNYPIWPAYTSALQQTPDGNGAWTNLGKAGVWAATTAYGPSATAGNVILDSNGNWQWCQAAGGTSGATVPVWGLSAGYTVTDGGITWLCIGGGTPFTTATISYTFSTHSIDGSVSTAAPLNTIPGPIVATPMLGFSGSTLIPLEMIGAIIADTQIDQIWIFRTAQGQATPVLEDQVPVEQWLASGYEYGELGIPDTSANGGGSLNALIAAPLADANNPPPAGFTGPVWYLQRCWGFVGNLLYASEGPEAVVGNGATAFSAIPVAQFTGDIVKVRAITVENGALLVYTTSGMHIILGTGTARNPFYPTPYCDKVNLANWNAEDILGSVLFLMEANGKVSSLTVQYPFNPQSGYSEVGLPIGDQFMEVTTGGISSALYTPATAFLSWCVANTKDAGMYVADGSVGWFRMSAVSPPESGLVWSPRAAIAGGTSAVQSVETSPGVYTLLIGPPTSGPILQRDQTGTVWDDNGTAFPAWDAKGVTQLCSSGEVAEVAWVATKSAAVGARPTVSLLMGEIKATVNTPWIPLQPTSQDPADQPPSQTIYSDRYSTQQGQGVTKSDCVLTKFDYGTQAFADELLDFAIFGAKEEERKAQ